MIFERYPYTNFHEMNLDWILHQISELKKEIAALPEMDEKIKELEEMLADLNEALAHALGMGLVDNSNYNLFAQILPDNNSRFNGRMFAQGFCIGEDAGRPVVAQMFVDQDPLDPDDPNVQTLFTLTHMDDGSRYVSYVDRLEHGNSLTYVPPLGRYLCATAGRDSDTGWLVEIDNIGHEVYRHVLPEPVWAVAYNQDVIYCIGKNGTLFKVDLDFNVTDSIPLNLQVGEFTYQGMAADDLYLYLFNGNTIPANTDVKNINRCSVFSHDGLPVKQVYMNYPLEIEEGDFYNGQFYLSSNTTHCALICKADMYTKNRSCSFGVAYDNIDLNQNGIEIHVKEDYKDFLVDGSNDRPLSAITWLMLWLRNSTDRMNIKIDTDITQVQTLSFRRCPNTIFDIDGQGNKLPNLLFDGGTLYLNNAIFPGIHGATSIQFFGNRLVINNITFGTDDYTIIPDKFITAYATCEINKIYVKQKADWMFMLNGSGYVRQFTGPYNAALDGYKFKMLLNGGFTADGTFPYNRVKLDNTWEHLSTSKIITNDQGLTYSYNDLMYPMDLVKLTSSTITDLPASVTGTIIKISVISYRTNWIQCTFLMSDNTEIVTRRSF